MHVVDHVLHIKRRGYETKRPYTGIGVFEKVPQHKVPPKTCPDNMEGRFGMVDLDALD